MNYELKWKLLQKQIQAGIDRFDSIFGDTRDLDLRAARDQNAWILEQMAQLEKMTDEQVKSAKLTSA